MRLNFWQTTLVLSGIMLLNLSSASGKKIHNNEIIVKFKKSNGPSAMMMRAWGTQARRVNVGEELGFHIVKKEKAKTMEASLKELNENPFVEYAEPNYIVHALGRPNDPKYALKWDHIKMQSEKAWDIHTGSRDVVVAVIDTGVDYTHPDLKNNMWVNKGEIAGNGVDDDGNGFVDDIWGWNFAGKNNEPMADDRDSYHGTHCAGIIGAEGNNGIGVAGVTHKVRIMALKFLDASGSGTTEDAIKSIQYAVDNGAKILNNSWGGGGFSRALKDAIDYANQKGVLFVAAAGNGGWDGVGDDNDVSPSYPASYDLPNVISVAATNKQDSLTVFSNFGKKSVHVAAPGNEILSTKNGGEYWNLSGTSMAAPQVAGLAALLLSYKETLTVPELKSLILDNVDKVSALEGKVSTGGRINVYKAVSAIAGTDPDPDPEPEPEPEPGDDQIAAQPLFYGLTWYIDYPAGWIAISYDVSSFKKAAYTYIEISKPDVDFSNPNGISPDPDHFAAGLMKGARGEVSLNLSYLRTPGIYSVRVIGLDKRRQPVSRFSDSSLLLIIQ